MPTILAHMSLRVMDCQTLIVAIVVVVQVDQDKAGKEAAPVVVDKLDNLDIVEVLQPDTVGKQGMLKPELVRMDYMLEAFLEHMRVAEDNQAWACLELALDKANLGFDQELRELQRTGLKEHQRKDWLQVEHQRTDLVLE